MIEFPVALHRRLARCVRTLARIVLGWLLVGWLGLGLPVGVHAATLDVPQQYASIQQGIDQAAEADVIRVSPGVYFENIDFRGKHLTIESTGGADVTTIDGRYGVHAVTMVSRDRVMILRGFTIRNGGDGGGPGSGLPGSRRPPTSIGGGVFASGTLARFFDCVMTQNRANRGAGVYAEGGFLTLDGCRIHGNYAREKGGGVLVVQAGAAIRDCWIHDNVADFEGGGIALEVRARFPRIERSTVERNRAGRGAGVYSMGEVRIVDNRILGNIAEGSGGGVTFNGGPASPVLEDNLIANNRAETGGGIATLNSTATIRRNTFTGNRAESGGAMNLYSWGEYPCTVEDNVVHQNVGSRYGGGVTLSADAVESFARNTLTRNRAPQGGGVFVARGAPRLDTSTISENRAGASGGGIHCEDAGVHLVDCRLTANESALGGGLSVVNGSMPLVIERCTLARNRAEDSGGAVSVFGVTNGESRATSSVFLANEAGGDGGAFHLVGTTAMHWTGVTVLSNVAKQRGGAVRSESTSLHVVNSIVWNNDSQGPAIDFVGSDTSVRFSVVQGGWPGPGNRSSDPRLVLDEADGVHLSITSPCVDAGSNDELYVGDSDIDGNERFVDGTRSGIATVDMGADESVPEHAVRYGSIGARTSAFDAIVTVNGSSGSSAERVVHGAASEAIRVAVDRPRFSSGAFALHANFGEPSLDTLAVLPQSVGAIGFPLLLTQGATPAAVWNGIGNPSYLGTSRYFDGSPLPDPTRAPAVVLDLPTGDVAHLPPGTSVTFQGIVHDRRSRASVPVSVTNGVVLVLE